MGSGKLEQLGWNPKLAKPPLIPARVIEVQRKGLFVTAAEGNFFAEMSGQLQKSLGDGNVCVGDWLLGSLSEKLFWVQEILPRRNLLERAAAGNTGLSQPMVANVDELWIVTCADEHFSLELTERYITMAVDARVEPILVLTKSDLYQADLASIEKRLNSIAIISVSSVTGSGTDSLRARLSSGQTIALMGSSGVGKSTLVNTLLSESKQQTGTTRSYDGKGKHTTTSRKLLLSPEGACLIDTPGMRSLASAKAEDVNSFPEIDALALKCRFRNCTHESEPSCAVQKAVQDGELPLARLKNFQKLTKEFHASSRSYSKKPPRG